MQRTNTWRRARAVLTLLCLGIAMVVVMPSTASASTGGAGEATGVGLEVGALSIDGVTILTGLTASVAEATAQPPDGNGNSTDTETVVVGVPPFLAATAITAQVDRTTGGLTSTADIADLSIDLLGVTDLVSADVVSSISDCPIDGVGLPSASVDVAGLAVAGTTVGVGAVDVPVDVDLGVDDVVDSTLYVTITQVATEDATGAAAIALRVSVDLVADLLVLPDIDLTLLQVDLAQTSCSVPLGIAPTAASLAPTSGPEGTTVTVTGTGFIPGATTVDIAGTTVPATDVLVSDDGTTAQFDVPTDAPIGPTTVVATTPAGSTGALPFEVTPTAPTATGILPALGPEGTVVTITGSDFLPGATSVDFGAIVVPAGDVTVAGDGNSLTFAVPDGAPLGPTVVTATTAGGATAPLGFLVTAVAAPTALTITPDEGPEGTTVTITGSDFVPTATSVGFGDLTVDAADVTVAPDGTSLTFDVPVGAPFGPTDVTVTTPSGTSDPLGFLVTSADVPTALSLTPDEGPSGVTVTIDGSDFVPTATSVGFGALTIDPADVTVAPDGTSLTFVVPDGAPLGPTAVDVTTPAGTSGDLSFTVTEMPDPPTASGLDPDQGPTGTVVELTGTDLVPGGTSIDVGGIVIPATEVTVSTDGTTATFEVPAGVPLGPVDVSATTPAGTTGDLPFLVTAGVAPTTAGIVPAQGPSGTVVTLLGSGFVPTATSVQFGGITIPATMVVVSADGTAASFTVPAGAPLGATPVTATTPDGTSAAETFTVTLAPPTIGSIQPGSGPVGTVVTVTGDGFVPGGTGVWLGPVWLPPEAVMVDGTGSLSFTVPAGAVLGTNQVRVVTAGGESNAGTFEVLASAATPVGGGGGTGSSGTLPYTGQDDGGLALVGMVLVALGGAAAGVGHLTRRRPERGEA